MSISGARTRRVPSVDVLGRLVFERGLFLGIGKASFEMEFEAVDDQPIVPNPKVWDCQFNYSERRDILTPLPMNFNFKNN
jgi:hypothetical protein